jgi:hypothetical protein
LLNENITFVDDRWNDPANLPLSNGPIGLTTPPETPSFSLDKDGQMIEFALPYPMHIVDQKPWPPLVVNEGNNRIRIHKPIPILDPYKPSALLGNEYPDAFYSLARASCDRVDTAFLDPRVVWPLIESAYRWIRVKARHYWLLHRQAGFSAVFHASVLTQTSKEINQKRTWLVTAESSL